MSVTSGCFLYAGDEGSRIFSWFKEHVQAITLCVDAGFPEAGLTLLYSGIEALGLLAAPSGTIDATGKTFKDWCEKYLMPKLQSVNGNPLTALDLWAARCGVLHTSTPVSKLGREGKAHELWYQFRGRAGVNLMANVQLVPLGLDIEHLVITFKEGGLAFIKDLNQDQTKLQIAEQRAGSFLRWGRWE
jgi:hypothetical protein